MLKGVINLVGRDGKCRGTTLFLCHSFVKVYVSSRKKKIIYIYLQKWYLNFWKDSKRGGNHCCRRDEVSAILSKEGLRLVCHPKIKKFGAEVITRLRVQKREKGNLPN